MIESRVPTGNYRSVDLPALRRCSAVDCGQLGCPALDIWMSMGLECCTETRLTDQDQDRLRVNVNILYYTAMTRKRARDAVSTRPHPH